MTSNNKSIIFNSIREAEQKAAVSIPAGYAPISLSTKGMVGAPATVHVRNFKIGEILSLSLTNEEDLPARLIEILNDAIYEDVDVGNWNEKEVEELMLYIYIIFYSPNLMDVEFPIQKSDEDYIKEKDAELYKDLLDKKWTPRVDLNLQQAVSTYDLPSSFSPNITIRDKETGFYITFGYVKYKDQLLVKSWLENHYKAEEIQFRKLREQIAYNEKIAEKVQSTNNFDLLDTLIEINEDELKAYKQYTSDKLQVLSEILRIVTILDFNGEDVSNLSLSEKYNKLANDPRIDYGLIKALNKKQEKVKYGIKPDVDMLNPITQEMCTRRFSFRIPSILLTMQVQGSNKYDDESDD